MAFVRNGIKLKSSENQARSAVPLAKAWNERQLRIGDTVDLAEVDNPAEVHVHPNAYLPSSVLRMAYSSVGRSIDDTGIGDRKASLTALEGVAGIISSAAARRFQADVSVMRRLGSPFVLARHYDWSPWNVAFGTLQAKIAPLARYYRHDGQKWVAVPYSEMLRTCRRGSLDRGVLELFAQTVEVSCPTLRVRECTHHDSVYSIVVCSFVRSCFVLLCVGGAPKGVRTKGVRQKLFPVAILAQAFG